MIFPNFKMLRNLFIRRKPKPALPLACPFARTVRLTQDAKTRDTGLVLLAGLTGRVIGFQGGNMIISFGLARFIALPPDSPFVEAVE